MKRIITPFLFSLSLTSGFSQANTHLSNLSSPTAVNQHLLPNSTNARDLGTSSLAWRSLYLRGYVYLDGTRFLSNAPGTSSYNAFAGSYSGYYVTSGKYNAALGHYAMYRDTSGSYNTAVGSHSLYNNQYSSFNAAVGSYSLYNNKTGYYNTAIGSFALYANASGSYNTAGGYDALNNNTTGASNTAFGFEALLANMTGVGNTAHGYSSLLNNGSGSYNVAQGQYSLMNNTSGSYNVGIGYQALLNNNASYYNTAIGVNSGYYNTSYSTFLGAFAQPSGSGLTNATSIGFEAIVNASNKVVVGNINVVSIGGYSNWTNFSDGRYKKNVKENVPGLDFINQLRPVTYTLDVDGIERVVHPGVPTVTQASAHSVGGSQSISVPGAPVPDINGPDQAMQQAPEDLNGKQAKAKIVYTGFVAQEVEKAAKQLNYDFSGVDVPKNSNDFYGLRYSDFVVPLVKAVQELDQKTKRIEALEKEVADLKQMMLDIKNGNTSNGATTFLQQNTPNPAKATTRIVYGLPTGVSHAKLLLTDAVGKTIKAVSLNGSGAVDLSTVGWSSGVYNYSLLVDGKLVETKRLTVAR